MISTIQVESRVKKHLEDLKVHPRESFNSVIERLVEENVDSQPLSNNTLKAIETALDDIRAGRVHTTHQVKKRLGL